MPVKFRSRRRRTTMSRKSGPKALRMVRNLSKFVDRELHHSDVSSGGTALGITSTPLFLALSPAALGDDSQDRTGLQITLRTIAYKQFWEVGNTKCCARVTLFRDNMGNGATPTTAELYEFPGSGAEIVVSPFNVDFQARFRILQDYYVTLDPDWKPVVCLKKFRRLGNIQRHQGPSSLPADIQKGGIWMALVSNTAGGGANPTVHQASRVRFAA